MTGPSQPGTRPPEPDRDRQAGARFQPWALYWGAWTLVGLYLSSLDLLWVRSGIDLEYILRSLGLNLTQNYAWGLLSLATIALARKVPLHKGGGARAWSLHLLASVVITCTGIAIMVSVVPWFYVPKFAFLPRLWRFIQLYFHYCFLVYYWGVVGLHEGIAIYRRSKERESAAYLLEAKLAQAQLQALKMQLNPHFLFNTLNAVSTLLHSDPATADRMLVKLGGLLRLSLEQSREQVTSLDQELAFLQAYLEIEQLRFGERLTVRIDVPKPLLEAMVPTFMLQPLVENAIKHGLSDRAAGGTIQIRARKDGRILFLEVEDDGPGVPGVHSGTGIGTQNTKSRLVQLYGNEQSFDLKFPAAGGALARISLPFSLGKDSQLILGGLP